jgi:hypothetical protein
MVMTPEQLKRMVFPGESGGDYNALFGYSNRPGGQFEGVNLTDMTVNQALQFSNPSGAYGQYVLRNRPDPEMGVATPMGAYQVVGRTLRAAMQGLGLTGDERMTPELQDQIGMWIYQNQGPGAWQAWGRGGGSGSASSGKGGAMPMGLFDMQEEPQTFGERLKRSFQSGELMDRLALAANSLRMDPDPNFAQMIQIRQEKRGEKETANRTAQWLISQNRQDLAEALMTGALDAKTAVATALTPAADTRTAMIQNYEYWLTQGKTPQEAEVLARSGAGGSVTNVNMADESQGALNKELAKAEGAVIATYLKQGPIASGSMQDLTLLEEVLQYAPQDPVTGRLAEYFPGVSSAGAAAQSIISRVAPTLRVEGSGSTSDIEYAGMLKSLPALKNYPEANAAIVGMMKAKAAIDIERANIVRDFANSPQTTEDAKAMRQRLSEIDSRSIMTPDLRRTIDLLGGAPATEETQTPAVEGATPPPAVGTIENGWRFKGGNPGDPNNWEKVQ